MAASSSSSAPRTAVTPLIPSLPDDAAVNIIARVPRFHHPPLSVVSKSFLSLLSSPHLFSMRRLLRCTEPSLYLVLCLPSSRHQYWYTLYSNPNPNSTSQKQHHLVPIASNPSPCPAIGSTFIALGPLIYVLGGSVNDMASDCVWVLDCRSHQWKSGPAMHERRRFAAAGVVGEKLYVMGGCTMKSWTEGNHWAEVLDLGAGSWAVAPSSSHKVRELPLSARKAEENFMHASAVVDGRIYAMAGWGSVVYDVEKEVWESVTSEIDKGWRGRGTLIGGVLYCFQSQKIRGFDLKKGVWKELKVVESWPTDFVFGVRMANLGGNLAVVWEGRDRGEEKEIWCAVIAVREDEHGELVGCFCWSNSVLKVSKWCSIVDCLVVDL